MELDYQSINEPNSPLNRLMNVHKDILFFWNVHKSNDNHRFFAMLSTITKVNWCDVMTVGGGEFGHAYAKFDDKGSVEKVQEMLGTLSIHNEGFPIYSQISAIGPCTRLVEAGRVICDGFDESWEEERLKNMFSPHGFVLEVQKFTPSGAVIFYGTEREALHAIEAINGKEFDGKAVRVFHYNISTTPNPMTNRRICLRPYNIPLDMKTEQLKQEFSFLGNVSARIFKKADGTSRGQGYVFMDTPMNDTPLLRSFYYFNLSDAILGLSWIGATYINKRPFREAKFTKFPPNALPDDKVNNLFHVPDVARKFVDEIEDYEYIENPSLLQCCLGAYHVHITNYEQHNQAQLIKWFHSWGKVIYSTTQEGFAIVSYNSLAEANVAVEKTNRLNKGLKAVLLDTYQLHHVMSMTGETISENLKNPPVGQWVYQFNAKGEIRKLPSDELMKTVEARNREISIKMHTYVDESNPANKDKKAEIAAYAKHMHQKAFMMGPAFGSYNMQPPSALPIRQNNAVVERVNRLFSKSTEPQKGEMIQVMSLLPPAEMQDALTDDDKFRQIAIKKIVEIKRLVRK